MVGDLEEKHETRLLAVDAHTGVQYRKLKRFVRYVIEGIHFSPLFKARDQLCSKNFICTARSRNCVRVVEAFCTDRDAAHIV